MLVQDWNETDTFLLHLIVTVRTECPKHKSNLLHQECVEEEGEGKLLVEHYFSGRKKCVVNPSH
jgi:hypothetical protein